MSRDQEVVSEAGTILGIYDVFLFDMDGTILTSIAAVERAWGAWSARSGADVQQVLAYIHGRTARDTITQFLPPGGDIAAEVRWLEDLELADLDGVAEIPGARQFLASLPIDRWAVVTSASRALATVRIEAAGLPLPPLLIASDDISKGKPDPEGYLKAAGKLGVDPKRCIVFEDTDAGMAAGLSAGAEVIQIAGDHAEASRHARFLARDYTSLVAEPHGESLQIVSRSRVLR